MIKSISLKKLQSDGQLDDLNDFRSRFSPSSFLNKWLNRDPELIKNSMIYNQFNNIIEIIDIARFYLIFSSENMINKYTREFMNKSDSDAIERIASYFLISSITFYNSSYDYVRILVRLLYSTREELIKQYKKKIKNKIEKWNLDKHDWYVALCKMITETKSEEENKWIGDNHCISEELARLLFELKENNKNLKRKYRANLVKHNAFPSFRRTNIDNSIEARFHVSLDSFCANKGGITCGIPKMLDIEEVQKYLIEYNNMTVKIVRSIAEAMSSCLNRNPSTPDRCNGQRNRPVGL